jgi:hypothetical protein
MLWVVRKAAIRKKRKLPLPLPRRPDIMQFVDKEIEKSGPTPSLNSSNAVAADGDSRNSSFLLFLHVLDWGRLRASVGDKWRAHSKSAALLFGSRRGTRRGATRGGKFISTEPVSCKISSLIVNLPSTALSGIRRSRVNIGGAWHAVEAGQYLNHCLMGSRYTNLGMGAGMARGRY